MSTYNENFQPQDFAFRGVDTKTDALRNHHAIPDASSDEFITYKANKEFPCFNYFAASRECLNRHGIDQTILTDRNCLVS